MTNQEYVDAVLRSDWPRSPMVPLEHAHEDARGMIFNLVMNGQIQGVAAITSKRGAVRANHVHATDWHFTFVARGAVYYFERIPGANVIPEPLLCPTFSMFFTPPGVEHAMLFAQDSLILTFAKNVRTHDNHEADLTRVEFVTPELAAKYVP